MILAGDVGGTKVHLALYDFTQRKFAIHPRSNAIPPRTTPASKRSSREFLGADQLTSACFGVPGPVRDGRLRLTNLPWTLDSRELAQHLKIEHVFLINDLEANGYGVAELKADQIYTLSEGDASQIGNRALIAAGTGLGEGILAWNGRIHVPMPSEGGHTDYGPRNEDEIDLLRFLKQKYNGRVSYERVVAGMGITNIYDFLRDVRGMEEPAWLARPPRQRRPQRGHHRTGPLRQKRTLRKDPGHVSFPPMERRPATWLSKYFPWAASTSAAASLQSILDKLKDGTFMRAFTDKGRLSQLLINMPVRVILESRAALLGAAAYAEARAAELSGVSPRAASVAF